MQTFAPEGTALVSGFRKLDTKRLGKQRLEAYQILRSIFGISDGWRNHPATIMWENRPAALAHYGVVCCEVWIERGYSDSLLPKFQMFRKIGLEHGDCPEPPRFLNDIAESHRSNLIRKDPEFYLPYWPNTKPHMPYFWPDQRTP